jgi:hypothetical protein
MANVGKILPKDFIQLSQNNASEIKVKTSHAVANPLIQQDPTSWPTACLTDPLQNETIPFFSIPFMKCMNGMSCPV